MIAAVAGHLGVNEGRVVSILGHHLSRGHKPDALYSIPFLLCLQFFLFPPKRVVCESDRAHGEGGGVFGRTHGGEGGVDVGGVLVLEFVNDEKVMGGFASRRGRRVGTGEYDGSASQGASGRPCGAFPLSGVPAVDESFLKALDAAADSVANSSVDDIPAGTLKQIEQVNEQMGYCFILSALARENEEKFVSASVEDGINDGS